MRGYGIHVEITDKPADIRFRLYDNGDLAVDNIGALDFQYLPDPEIPYIGVHTLETTYFQTFDPTVESAKKEVYEKDFTLPILDYQVTVEILS